MEDSRHEGSKQELGLRGSVERRRHDADDGEVFVVQTDGCADDGEIGFEALPPGEMRNYDKRGGGRLVFLGEEEAAEERSVAGGLEEVRRHVRDANRLGSAVVVERQFSYAIGCRGVAG